MRTIHFTFRDLSVHPDGQIDGQTDMARSTDQEYVYFMGSETLPSACYILSDESNIPFYSTSNGYNVTASLLLGLTVRQ